MRCSIRVLITIFAKTTNTHRGKNVFLTSAKQSLINAAARLVEPAAVLFSTFALTLATCFFATSSFAQKWSELKAPEQQALAPLANDWDGMTDSRKKKWRDIAAKYPTMPPDQQKNLQDRMQGWSQLSPDERKKARERYQEIKQLPPDKRAAVPQKWDEYRNLPPEKQEEMRKKAAAAKASNVSATPVTDDAKKNTPK
jgi:hypothetical protein